MISIGRQYGSGGHAIGQYLALKLGFDFYDKEIISETAGITGYSEDYIQKTRKAWAATSFTIFLIRCTSIPTATTHQKTSSSAPRQNVIRDLAAGGNCVIVGRCSDYILRDYDRCVSLFLHAPLERRVARIIRTENYG